MSSRSLVEYLAAGTFLFQLRESTIHFSRFTKGDCWQHIRPVLLQFPDWSPPDGNCSIMVHPSGRGHGLQLSHSLQIKSMSDPSWASCLKGGFESTRSTLRFPRAAYISDCVCIQNNRIKGGPCSPRELSIWLYMLSDRIRRLWHIH